MQETIKKHRDWIRWLMRREDKAITPLAVDAKLSSNTLSRMDEPEFNGFSQRTINAVMKFYDAPDPIEWSLGLSEEEALPFSGPPPEFNLKTTAKKSEKANVWTVHTDDLSDAGYRRGDLVLIDTNVTPRNGDIVIAQLYDIKQARTKTLMRVFSDHYLCAASIRGKPQEIITITAGHVSVLGVVTARLWLRDPD